MTKTREHVKENGWEQKVTVARKQLFIADEIALKVRDTCAGVFAATLNEIVELQAFSIAVQQKLPVHIVLFLQQDETLDRAADFRRLAQRIADKIQQQLIFINLTVEFVNRYTLSTDAQWRVA
ncbi:hypothetical protein [Methylocucumis oryzae]|uniref:hypothetical protein n=1 Tax=Methylocucumis oryzae TaxID=1632867 RepID=UPI0010397CCD|nr:hypothetical protein [Methylocucumis oryzae]